MDALGNLLVMWTDDSSANTEVFSACAPTGDSVPGAAIAPLPGGGTVDAGTTVRFVANVTQVDPNDPTTSTWDFGDGTAGTGSPVDHSFAAPGTYVVTLKVRDALGLVSTATTTVTVRAPAFTGGPEQLLPVVLDTPGAGGTHYTSELTLASKAGAPVTVLLQYTASVGSGSGFASLTLAAGELRIIPDAIAFLRTRSLAIPEDGSAQIGTLRAVFQGASSSSDVFIGARTSTPGAGGTFGLFYTAAATSTTTATVFGLQQNAAQRSNLALINAGPDPITLRVALQGPNGETLTGPRPDAPRLGLDAAQPAAPRPGDFRQSRRHEDLRNLAFHGLRRPQRRGDLGRIVRSGHPPGRQLRGRPPRPDRPERGRISERADADELHEPAARAQPDVHGLAQLSAAGSGIVPFTLQAGEQRIEADAMTFLRNLGLPIPTSGNVGGALLVKAPSGTPASSLAAGRAPSRTRRAAAPSVSSTPA